MARNKWWNEECVCLKWTIGLNFIQGRIFASKRGREGGREGGMEGGREGGMEGGREGRGGREGGEGREGGSSPPP